MSNSGIMFQSQTLVFPRPESKFVVHCAESNSGVHTAGSKTLSISIFVTLTFPVLTHQRPYCRFRPLVSLIFNRYKFMSVHCKKRQALA